MVQTFAAIDVGSYDVAMKIYEITNKNDMHQIDYVRHSIDMGTQSYTVGKLSSNKVDELCSILKEFKLVMKSYDVKDYIAYGTSAIRETVNTTLLLSQIYQRTGIKIEVLSNSEQRFLDYKSVAFQNEKFESFIENSTAIYDVGGGSVQISLFDKDTLVSTQNMKLGVLRMLERLNTLGAPVSKYEMFIDELLDAQLSVYKKLYLKDKKVPNLILVDDYIANIINYEIKNRGITSNIVDIELINKCVDIAKRMSFPEMAKALSVNEDAVPKIYISLLMLQRVMLTLDTKMVWAPGVTLCDGIAYEYAQQKGILDSKHDFDEDITACAMQISKRYMGSRKRAATLEKIAMTIFNATKELHGLNKRDSLLLRISAILHDCGKYISMANLAECSYEIIMSTEIIGLSHKERMIVANIVRFNQLPFEYYKSLSKHESIEMVDHMRIAKLTAILRLANGLDRSHKMKFKDVKVSIEDDKLLIDVATDEDITLEKGLFGNRAEFFEEVFNLKPVIRQHRSF